MDDGRTGLPSTSPTDNLHVHREVPALRHPRPALFDTSQTADGGGQIDLAQTVNTHSFAANALKHGSGKSLRELEKIESALFTLQGEESKALNDVTADGFLGGWVE